MVPGTSRGDGGASRGPHGKRGGGMMGGVVGVGSGRRLPDGRWIRGRAWWDPSAARCVPPHVLSGHSSGHCGGDVGAWWRAHPSGEHPLRCRSRALGGPSPCLPCTLFSPQSPGPRGTDSLWGHGIPPGGLGGLSGWPVASQGCDMCDTAELPAQLPAAASSLCNFLPSHLHVYLCSLRFLFYPSLLFQDPWVCVVFFPVPPCPPAACFLIRALTRSSPRLCFSWGKKKEVIASLVKLALAERAPGERCCPGGAGANGSPCCPPAAVPSAGGQPLTPINTCHLPGRAALGCPATEGHRRFGRGLHRYLPSAVFPRVGFSPGTIFIAGPLSWFGHLCHSGLCAVPVPGSPAGLGGPWPAWGLRRVCVSRVRCYAQVCLCLEQGWGWGTGGVGLLFSLLHVSLILSPGGDPVSPSRLCFASRCSSCAAGIHAGPR